MGRSSRHHWEASRDQIVARCAALWSPLLGLLSVWWFFEGAVLWWTRGDSMSITMLYALGIATVGGALATYVLPPLDPGIDLAHWPPGRMSGAPPPNIYRRALGVFPRWLTWAGILPAILSGLVAYAVAPSAQPRPVATDALDALFFITAISALQWLMVWGSGWGFQFMWIAIAGKGQSGRQSAG